MHQLSSQGFIGDGGRFSPVISFLLLLTLFWSAEVQAADESKTHRIVIKKFRFVPARLTINSGDRVEWVNRDIAPHTATSNDEGWDTGQLNKGDAAVIVFRSAGTHAYICTFHPSMRAEVTVLDPAQQSNQGTVAKPLRLRAFRNHVR